MDLRAQNETIPERRALKLAFVPRSARFEHLILGLEYLTQSTCKYHEIGQGADGKRLTSPWLCQATCRGMGKFSRAS